ncbi:hypothetical protein ACLOJK_024838, partial [Asimina triloba]
EIRSPMADSSSSNGDATPPFRHQPAAPSSASAEASRPSFLLPSTSFKGRRKGTPIARAGSSEVDDLINLLHGSDPVRVELNRLENEVRGRDSLHLFCVSDFLNSSGLCLISAGFGAAYEDLRSAYEGLNVMLDKDRELADAQAEIKALKHSERLREKAVEELTDELKKAEVKLKVTEVLLENKNLEIKKITDEKKAALAAQFAAEATLRRVHAAQKDDDMPPIEAIITPLEAELKISRQEVAKLQEDNRALDRLTKSKEAALLEAERTVQIALAKASLVDDLQNKNQELMKQIEICQEENKILDKLHRQKVAEVEKLSQTVRELEESVLAGGAAANAVRDYQRKVQEMNVERKTLDRELARAKVSANRVAVVVANEWKDANDKGEMQQLREKLAVAERTAKSEAQLKEKFQLRLKVLEERLKASPSANGRTSSEVRSVSNGRSRRQSLGGAESLSRSSSMNGSSTRKTSSSPFRSTTSGNASMLLKFAKGSSRSFDGGSRSIDRDKPHSNGVGPSVPNNGSEEGNKSNEMNGACKEGADAKPSENPKIDTDDYVSGVFYDMLQKEVIALRKASHEKDQSLKDKDDAIEMLAKKVDTLNKAMEVEAKKMRREVAAMEKEVAAIRVDKEHDLRARRLAAAKGPVNGSQLLAGR